MHDFSRECPYRKTGTRDLEYLCEAAGQTSVLHGRYCTHADRVLTNTIRWKLNVECPVYMAMRVLRELSEAACEVDETYKGEDMDQFEREVEAEREVKRGLVRRVALLERRIATLETRVSQAEENLINELAYIERKLGERKGA